MLKKRQKAPNKVTGAESTSSKLDLLPIPVADSASAKNAIFQVVLAS